MNVVKEFLKGKNVGRVLFNRLVEKHVKVKGITLDLGCTGKMSYYRFMDTGKGRIFMADIEKRGNATVILNLEKELPFHNNSVDNVILFNVLEHIYNPYKVLEEIYRILKKNGKVYTSIPFMIYYHPSPRDYNRYTKEKLERIFDGFHIETFETIGGFFTVFDYNFTTYFLDAIKIKLLKNVISYIFYIFSRTLDRKMSKIKRNYKEKFPLSYFIVAKKQS